jgi:F420-dependent oxidoreductase-like protein
MKLAVNLNPGDDNWEEAVAYAQEAEQLGIESIWLAETWGYDAATPLAYLAAKTSRIKLGTGIMQIGSRSPALVAMTALTLASLSHDRFILGLGVSGPQVIEGWYGVSFARPYQRLKEMLEIVKMGLRGERLQYQGEIYQLPLPGGEGKALRPSAKPRPNLPIYLATLGPKNLELTGQLADGWLGTSFIPEHAAIFTDHLAAGAAKAGRPLSELDIQVWGGVVDFADDGNLAPLIAPRKPGLAFTLGAMGSKEHNFYNQVYQRAGYAEVALAVQDLWLKGQREAAIALIPDELILKTNLIGTEEMVKERLRAHRRAGVTTLRVEPEGQTPGQKMHTLSRLLELIKQIEAE